MVPLPTVRSLYPNPQNHAKIGTVFSGWKNLPIKYTYCIWNELINNLWLKKQLWVSPRKAWSKCDKMWILCRKYECCEPDCDNASWMAKQFVDARPCVTFNIKEEEGPVLKETLKMNSDHHGIILLLYTWLTYLGPAITLFGLLMLSLYIS